MPTRPLSHSERERQRRPLPRGHDDYDHRVRRHDAALWLAKRYRSSTRWHKVRQLKLARNPLCENPYGRHEDTVPATEVDHRLPLRTHPQLAFTLDNLQSLCHACHAKKSGAERALAARGVL